jgi:hypothetical protein
LATTVDDRGVRVELLYFDGCPNWIGTEAALREALEAVGAADTRIERNLVTTLEEASRVGFTGSPTVLIDGRDPFAEPTAPVALACRMYRTESGLAGTPSRKQLIAALQTRMDDR